MKIGQWVKTKDFVGDALAFRVHYATVSGSYISKSMPVSATQDWTYYEYIIDLPAAFETIKVEILYDYAQGHVWIDNTTCWGYIKATGIEVNTDSLVMNTGETFQLELEYLPANTTIKEVTYASSNEAVMTVSETGLVSAVADGCATITYVDGTKKEIGVLVADETAEYTENVEITTQQNVNVVDVLPEGWSYSVAAAPQYGTYMVIGDCDFYYYPAKNFYGEDSVTLLAVNADGGKVLVILPLFVEQLNAAPCFDMINVLTAENNAVSGKITALSE